jgi:hypothetical protein
MSTPRTKKIEDLRARLSQLEAAEKAAAARVRAAASKTSRRDDTRRKILLGSFLLDQLKLTDASVLKIGGVSFASWLTRPTDLSLFALLPPASPAGEAQTHQREV